MNENSRICGSSYMEWAKTRASAKFNLATSGVENFPAADFPIRLEDIELNGPSFYGFKPLQQALAAKCKVQPESVVAATGASLANHLAVATLVNHGDEILIERPTYQPLLAVANYLGARINRFERRFEDGFQADPEAIERAITKKTKLIVITNLHNPSGAFTDQETLLRIGEIARHNRANVLVDEVYLEAMFEQSPGSAFHLGDQFITTNSLTKAYGLSGLRCGWILAEPELAMKIWRLNDLFGVVAAHPAETLSLVALKNLSRMAERAKRLLDENRIKVNSFLSSRTELSCKSSNFGTILFPRLINCDVNRLCRILRDKYETTVVPGEFFEMAENFRLGIGCNTDSLSQGLQRLGSALDELKGEGR